VLKQSTRTNAERNVIADTPSVHQFASHSVLQFASHSVLQFASHSVRLLVNLIATPVSHSVHRPAKHSATAVTQLLHQHVADVTVVVAQRFQAAGLLDVAPPLQVAELADVKSALPPLPPLLLLQHRLLLLLQSKMHQHLLRLTHRLRQQHRLLQLLRAEVFRVINSVLQRQGCRFFCLRSP
jgi:hypothetical protein